MNIEFFKYQGTGNDFVILDNRNEQYNGLTTQQIRFMCDRRFGIGADGLMLLNLLKGYDFEMKYYNADGSESTMCGNGGRCLVKFANDMGIKKPHYTFLAIDGPHEASFANNDWVRLKMKDVNEMDEDDGNCIVDTGSPHYVKIVNDVKKYNVFEEGKQIRYSKKFKEEGINVNFVEIEHGHIYVRTYERGVENETFSCGTGVTASALACAHNTGFNKVQVETLGGHLAVEFQKDEKDHFSDIWLCGPATYVYKGEIEI
ncbi:diaminopimelate epimerase [Segetibacter sp.]|jgi:diaminopimelate epimerase|uniref:diaminopimelate epimerase n=1 Tax=Segetibacter sp. TaxID=2231182 RepID=UPI0026388C4B|nr:diaminopimelate epimerase [Segetibacter sp.]MCW3080872.1 diaminopimelate epimerase [Segetibacter sp.]